MSKKHTVRPSAEQGGQPLVGLAELRRQLASHPAPSPAAETPADEPGEDEAALFRAAVSGTRPLPASDRAELEAPRPKPVPRAKAPEPAADPEASATPRRSPATEGDLLREAMAGVAPLRESGRAELGGSRAKLRPDPGQPTTGLPVFPTELPSDIDPHDPAQLFRYAVAGAQPLEGTDRLHLERPTPAPLPRQRTQDEQAVLKETLHAPLSFEDRLDMGDEAAFLRAGLPRRVLTDLRRGRWVVQGELDLHGLTREEARATLSRFLAVRLQQGSRCLRIIHGKGLGSPGGVGLLKQLSRSWLAQREEILAFCQARPHDGGEGALLVLLRASRGREMVP
jgi:DNA-nicking Smr family endonuclease